MRSFNACTNQVKHLISMHLMVVKSICAVCRREGDNKSIGNPEF